MSTIQFFVRFPPSVTFEMSSDALIETLRSAISAQTGINADSHTSLMFGGTFLQNGTTLNQCGIQNDCTIHYTKALAEKEKKTKKGKKRKQDDPGDKYIRAYTKKRKISNYENKIYSIFNNIFEQIKLRCDIVDFHLIDLILEYLFPKVIDVGCSPANMVFDITQKRLLFLAAKPLWGEHNALYMKFMNIEQNAKTTHHLMSFPPFAGKQLPLSLSAVVTINNEKSCIYISDFWNHCIHVYSLQGHYLQTIEKTKLSFTRGLAYHSIRKMLFLSDYNGIHVFLCDGTYLYTFAEMNDIDICDRHTGPLAIDEKNDEIYLVEEGEKGVSVYSCDGVFKRCFGPLPSYYNKTTYNNVTSIAFHPLHNVILMTQSLSHDSRLCVFDTHGKFLRSYGFYDHKRPARAGAFYTPHGICIDPFTGAVYVSDLGNYRIQVFYL